MGYADIDGKIAELSFRNLRQTYKNVLDRRNKSRSGNVPWVWFDEFHDWFHEDVVFNSDGLT